MNRLLLHKLTVGRGGFRRGPLSLAVEAGSRVALLGPNGCGKTTLLKTVAGLLPPVAGVVLVDDEPVRTVSARRRAALAAYLPPPGEVQGALSARHMAALGRIARRPWPADLTADDAQAAEEVLRRFAVEDLADRTFDTLSSGERQLVLLARTAIQGAAVCVLDEPSATLDPAHRRAVARVMAAMAQNGAAILFSTHDPAEARGADLCILLGDTVATGPPGDVLTRDGLGTLYGQEWEVCPTCGRAH